MTKQEYEDGIAILELAERVYKRLGRKGLASLIWGIEHIPDTAVWAINRKHEKRDHEPAL